MLLLILSVLFGCDSMPPLSGTIQMSNSSEWSPKVYLVDPKSWSGIAGSFMGSAIDSAAIDVNGHFAFERLPHAAEPQLFELVIQKQSGSHYPNRLDDDDPNTTNYCPFVYKNGENIVIHTEDAHFLRSYSIENPSAENTALLQLRNIRQAAYNKYLAPKGESTHHDEANLLDEEKAKIAYQESLMQFANETSFLLPALTAIRWVSVEGNYERVPEFIVSQAERWNAIAPNHAWVKQLYQKADRKSLPVLVGDIVPDYSIPMLAGDTLPLYQLLGKGLTLIDLWASWCAPCRKENRNYLVPLWDSYHDKGFQIVGYALDSDAKTWLNAIKKDGADRWHHASDLQGDNAALFKQLRLASIPANFLVDEKGKVLAKNLHGEELMQFVDGFFNQK